jgi:cyanophycinase
MIRLILLLLAITLAAPLCPAGQSAAQGSLVISGGNLTSALDRIQRRFIELGGGAENIRLAIIPAGSIEPAVSGRENAADFIRLGVDAGRVRVFPLAVVDDPSTPGVDESHWAGNGADAGLAREMREYSAVYFVGGDQIRYTQTLKTAGGGDTPLLRAIREVYARGGVIGGSSAGAAMMCDPMICDGFSMKALLAGAAYQPASCPGADGVSLAAGLGFFTAGMVDQHFLKRGRIGRLLVALSAGPAGLGLGIDEDTSAVCRGGAVEVIGSSGVLVVDAVEAKASGGLSWSLQAGLRARGVIVHYLEEGDRFDLVAREPLPRPERRPLASGKEANEGVPLETNLFAPDAFRNMMVDGLAENRLAGTAGIAFTLDAEGRGQGSRWTLRKTPRFAGLYASIRDVDTYSVTYASLEVEPITLRIEKK